MLCDKVPGSLCDIIIVSIRMAAVSFVAKRHYALSAGGLRYT
jgi:hypothetical protein